MENNENGQNNVISQQGGQPVPNKTTEVKETDKPVVSKKFKQETYTAPSGRQYLMTFPGMRKALKLQSDAAGNESDMHQMFMDKILEGNFNYPYFNNIDDGVDKQKSIDVEQDDGSKVTFKVGFKNIKQFDDFRDSSIDSQGQFSEYLASEYAIKNLVQNDISINYFDEHKGYTDIMTAISKISNDIRENSEFMVVMNAVKDFLNKMFQ
ncbi:hypothetical protein DY138_00730 [Apilactobacillus timberlakei]|uniref:hypothetical protein n=1 Tax=Apilactobacillus timberlakei TaxID=2008380 RepID=UPI00112C6E8C|nr:hypothetical protein [Apilactobacillus timberlakei]TPR19994.1 hypothetical protein DY138_00730 [Apilactobacillus timberlakei]TPR21712.1 hypothetical protein DY061_00645 [Apilactobacillus timberlakei]TPR22958.1 hypothetical protein DY083_02465 [Apilactobacillus timberlakei]